MIFFYEVRLCLIAVIKFLLKNFYLHLYNFFVIPIPGCNIHINIYFPSSVFKISTEERFTLYKYRPANPCGQTV
jgi:hypothetical protein